MPELPEVETIRRQLEQVLVGKTIRETRVFFGKKINVPAKKFTRLVKGRKFLSVCRRAKILIFNLSGGMSFLVHLKMTGRLLYVGKNTKPSKHTHAVFNLSNGRKLFWEDIRKFGYIKVMPTAGLDDYFQEEGFGPEPLAADFDFEIFKQCLLGSPKKKIKPLLMEQKCLAGIGNIYADEGLWYAGVQPTRSAGSLSLKELRGLYQGVRKSLLESIKYRGTSTDSYLDAFGRAGEYVPRLRVYGRTGAKCRRGDGGIIKKIRLGGRGAHFCPVHQK